MLKRLRRPLVVRTFSLGRTGAFRACDGRSGVGAGVRCLSVRLFGQGRHRRSDIRLRNNF